MCQRNMRIKYRPERLHKGSKGINELDEISTTGTALIIAQQVRNSNITFHFQFLKHIKANEVMMRVLSLFDGMACGMLAMKSAGVNVERYDAYEIDQYAIKVANHNFPSITQHGDVFEADFAQYEGVDWLIGGSPCTYWSIAKTKNRETVANGMGWELFSQYVRALHEVKPKLFIYENNKSMSKDIRASIDEAFGFEAICINSALVSAQTRQRLYWVGKRNVKGTYDKVDVSKPQDRGILLKDVLEANTNETRYILDSVNISKGVPYNCMFEEATEPIRVGTIENKLQNKAHDSKQYRVYSSDGKSTTLCGQGGGVGAKTGLYATPAISTQHNAYEVKDGMITIKNKQYPVKLTDGFYIIRKLTVRECMRLQTVPEWYDFSCISNTQAYKCLGNGWTVEVIAHLIREALKRE